MAAYAWRYAVFSPFSESSVLLPRLPGDCILLFAIAAVDVIVVGALRTRVAGGGGENRKHHMDAYTGDRENTACSA